MRKYILFMFLCLHYVARGQTNTQKFTYAVGDEIRTDTCVYIVRGSNLITNSSFDDGTTGWMAGDGNSLSETYFEVVTSGGADGGAYLKCLGGAGTNTNQSVKTSFAISPGKTYLFSCWAYRTNSSDNRQWSRLFLANANQGIDIEVEHINFQQDTWSHTEAIIEAGEYTFLTVNLSWLDNASSFDCFTLMEVEVSDEVVTTRLQETIASAEQRLAETEEGTENGQYLPETRQALQEAINAAKAIVAHPASQQQVSQAVQALNAAVVTYNRHVNPIFVSGYEYRYWFDGDISTMVRDVSLDSQWHFDADLGGLEPSLHTIHIQVKDEDGNLSSPQTRFFIQPIHTSSNDSKTICWFDNDYSTKTVHDNNGVPFLLDVSSLYDGVHIMHLQVEGGERGYSSPRTASFIKYPQVIGVDYLTCLCMIDGQLYKQERVSAQGGVINWTFDVASLSQGLHRVFVQVLTPSGASTSARQGFFFRVPTDLELEEMECVYCIDGSEFYQQAGQVANGLYHFDVDVSDLEDGLHRITYMLSNGKGVSTKAITQFFTKIPLGGNGIAQYYYWLNDNDADKKTVTLNERQKTLSLISLLPVESEPIRSSCFELRVENGNPVMYAKNDMHIRFLDAAGRFADATGQYVDEKVKQAVTGITPIESGVTQTINRPEENSVKWFSLQAIRGDSLTFKVDKASTIQCFSPTGDLVLTSSGAEATKYSGCYAKEDGTYYLAVHDVTAQYASQIKVDYQHIDKYAVLTYTPDTIGAYPSFVNMVLDGNGFDKLEDAMLILGEDTIFADSITIYSKSFAVVKYTLLGQENLGEYDMKLCFSDEGQKDFLTIDEAVSVVDPIMGDVIVNVTTKRTLASPYPVTVTVTNTGNTGLLYVPFNIAAENPGWPYKNAWTILRCMNFRPNYGTWMNDSVDVYQPWVWSENLFNKHVYSLVLNFFIPRLGPHETKEYIVGFTGGSHARFNFYAWTGKPLNYFEPETDTDSMTNIPSIYKYLSLVQQQSQGANRRGPTIKMAPDVSNLVNGLDAAQSLDPTLGTQATRLAGATGVAISSGVNQGRLNNLNAYEDMGAIPPELDETFNDYRNHLNDRIFTPEQILDLSGLHNNLPDWAQAQLDLFRDMLDMRRRQAENADPLPPAYPIEILNPGDPNDIFGYTSESGSKYMREEIMDIPYTIEFENDPEIATASAHTIVVKDTLDSQKFDLNSFGATIVKIGDKVMNLDGEQQFTKTMDLRPAIDVIAEVSLDYNKTKGIATWTINSLDPMTMEHTEDAMQGVLPVNVNGNGMGEVGFKIKLKKKLAHEATVSNKAAIIFDNEGVIMTPVWTNTVDAILPTGKVTDAEMASATTAKVTVEASDELSKPWQYTLYQKTPADEDWRVAASDIPVDSVVVIKIESATTYDFYAVVADSAGNKEVKQPKSEFRLTTLLLGDANDDGKVTITDAVSIVNKILGNPPPVFRDDLADFNCDGKVSITDAVAIVNKILGGDDDDDTEPE